MGWTWPWRGSAGNDAARLQGAGLHAKSWAPSGFFALHMQGEASWTRRDYATLAREGFMKNPVVHRSLRLVAETAAAIPWLLYDGDHEATGHPLMALLDRPNARQAGASFLEALYGHLLISGNAYVEPVAAGDRLAELHLLRPDRVSVKCDASGWPVALDYRAGSQARSVPLGDAGEGGALQLSLFHPLDDHYGFAPLEAATMALDTHNAAGRWNKALLDNSARPSGALVYAPKDGGNLSDDQYDRLKSELEEGYSGATRAGRPLLLEGGLDWKTMSLSPKDMDFAETRNAASRDIALAFGVPPMLLGIPGDNTYSNYQEANRAFYRTTVLPLVARTARELTAWLAPLYGERMRLWYDADQVEGLNAERDALWARVGAASFLTDDEKRQAVGYDTGHSGSGLQAKFRPDQPRVPAGNTDGGQWTDGGGGASIIPVQSRTRGSRGGGGPRRIQNQWRDLTPEQETRLEISESQMRAAVGRVRELEPAWKPTPSLYETVEGEIAANEAAMREALNRHLELLQGNRRTDHAVLREQQGRPIASAFPDAQRARNSDVFVDTRSGNFVIRGANGRQHWITPAGRSGSSTDTRTHAAHLARLRRGAIRRATPEEYELLKKLVR